MTDDDLKPPGEGDDFLKEPLLGHRGSGVIGIVDKKDLCLFRHLLWNLEEPWKKSIHFSERKEIRDSSGEEGGDPIDRIAGIRDQNIIPRLHKSGRDGGDHF